MAKEQMRCRRFVILAGLAILTTGLTSAALIAYQNIDNTSSSQKTDVSVVVSDAADAVKTDAIKVAVPSKVYVVSTEGPSRLDKAVDVLALSDARLYRAIFAAQQDNDLAKADKAIALLSDKRLMGAVLADRYLRYGAAQADYAAWLAAYGDWSDAETIYAQAKKAQQTALKAGSTDKHGLPPARLPLPKTPDAWSGGYVMDSASDFRVDLKIDPKSMGPSAKLARDIVVALRKGDPDKAASLFVKANADDVLAGTFAADAGAAIAASFYFQGERQQAVALSAAAAGAQQPVGLWIRGLIAWEQDDLPTASASFTKLADHPAISPASRAAAAFWAYRAWHRLGDQRQARNHLEVAADQAGSFYGLLAADLLGRDPVTDAANPKSLPRWNREHRAALLETPAGFRALALVQVGQSARAEAELRRLNPQGQGDLQQAMLALAGFVPMPSLALHLASLMPAEGKGVDLVSYPVPPWKPEQGFQVDRALMFALMRHESRFDPRAVSSQGAHGLMQIMPATARGLDGAPVQPVALRMGGDTEKLFDPAYNMALGQRYVRHLAAQPLIGNNLMLLLAAYNAGPTKISRLREDAMVKWDAKHRDDPFLFLESLPGRETRGYVTRVMTHYWAYCAKLGKPLTSLRALASGQWPRFDGAADAPVKAPRKMETAQAGTVRLAQAEGLR